MKTFEKIKKLWVTPKIEKIAIFYPPQGYLGMSKQMQSLHWSDIKHEQCIKVCEQKDEL